MQLTATPPRMRVYAFTGWVLPAIMTLIVMIVDVSNNWEPIGLGSGNSHCWLSSTAGLIGAVLVPIGLVLVHNLYIMIRVRGDKIHISQSVFSHASLFFFRSLSLCLSLLFLSITPLSLCFFLPPLLSLSLSPSLFLFFLFFCFSSNSSIDNHSLNLFIY